MLFNKNKQPDYKKELEELKNKNQRLQIEIERLTQTQSTDQRTACANCQYGLKPPSDCYAPYICLLKANEICADFKIRE